MATPLIFPASVFQASFGQETSFGSGTGSTLGVLGVQMSVEDFKQDNQFEALYRLGSRAAQLFYSKGLVVDASVKFTMATDNKSWLNLLLNLVSTTSGNYWTVPDKVGTLPSSFMDLQDENNRYYIAKGFVVDNAKFSFEEGKTCDVDLTMKGQTVTYQSSTAPVPSTFNSDGTLNYPINFTTWANVQVVYNGNYGSTTFGVQPIKDLSISVKNDLQFYYGLGSIEYVGFVPQKLDVSGKLDILHDSKLIEHILTTADTESSTNAYTLVLTVGSNYGNPYTITIEGLYWSDGSMTFKPVDPVVDEFNFKARNIKIS
jgi:hypothetical protein